mgnify:CR=1 FL=1
MSYVDIANEELSDFQIDGEDYYVALRNLENKYGYDEDIAAIIRMCSVWENSFHKMEGRWMKLLVQQLYMKHKLKLY